MIEVFFVFAWTRHCHLSEGESSRDEWCERLVSDWLAIRPDSSPLLTPNYLTEISLTVESEKKTILKTNVTQWVKECVYSTKRGKTEALPKYAGVYTSGVEPWWVAWIESLTLSMGSDQPTDIRATSVQRIPYSPVHSRVIVFPLKFTKKVRITKTYKAERPPPRKPVYQRCSSNGGNRCSTICSWLDLKLRLKVSLFTFPPTFHFFLRSGFLFLTFFMCNMINVTLFLTEWMRKQRRANRRFWNFHGSQKWHANVTNAMIV